MVGHHFSCYLHKENVIFESHLKIPISFILSLARFGNDVPFYSKDEVSAAHDTVLKGWLSPNCTVPRGYENFNFKDIVRLGGSDQQLSVCVTHSCLAHIAVKGELLFTDRVFDGV